MTIFHTLQSVKTPTKKQMKPQTQNSMLITSKVATTLDRVGLSNRKASMILEALIEDKHIEKPAASPVSHSTIRRARMKNREELSAEVHVLFNILLLFKIN